MKITILLSRVFFRFPARAVFALIFALLAAFFVQVALGFQLFGGLFRKRNIEAADKIQVIIDLLNQFPA